MERNRIKIFGEHEPNTVEQIEACAQDDSVLGAVLCADGHFGYHMPIGGVVAYEGKVSPSGVGFDIGCGNKAVLTDADADDVERNIETILDDIWANLSFSIGRKNYEKVDHPVLEEDTWDDIPFLSHSSIRQKSKQQLGTIGSGNHYVDLFRDEHHRIWIGVHFGSRGVGHTIATYFMEQAGGSAHSAALAPPALLDVNSPLGEDYLRCMKLAGQYAYAGRDWVCDKVASILGAKILESVHNHHNFAWKETHSGKSVWVVRKGATPAFPGQKGFVGGSMGDDSVILEGAETAQSKEALYSTVHGAGRVLSRTRAAGRVIRKGPNKGKREGGEITPDMMQSWVQNKGVALRGAGCDEAPQCYKRLDEVLAAHSSTVRILHTLHPIGVCMAGEGEFDPYKD